jgi:Na+-driven multidrug efflux pump
MCFAVGGYCKQTACHLGMKDYEASLWMVHFRYYVQNILVQILTVHHDQWGIAQVWLGKMATSKTWSVMEKYNIKWNTFTS